MAQRVDALLTRLEVRHTVEKRQLVTQLLMAADLGLDCQMQNHDELSVRNAKLERRISTWENLGPATVDNVQRFLAGQMSDEEAIELGFMRAPASNVEARFSVLLEILRDR